VTTVSRPVAMEMVTAFIRLYTRLRDASGARILARADLTMRDAAAHARLMTIVEIMNDDEWIIRLNGTGHCTMAHIDRTGRNALATCPPEERARRRANAEAMFGVPCGLIADLSQGFADGTTATLLTTSLPLLGKEGQRMILTYGPQIEEVADPSVKPSEFAQIEIDSHHFIDLGYGLPNTAQSAHSP